MEENNTQNYNKANQEFLQNESIEQENVNQEILESESLEYSLKEKQKKILSTLKDYRSKNTYDLIWFIVWVAVLGGGQCILKIIFGLNQHSGIQLYIGFV